MRKASSQTINSRAPAGYQRFIEQGRKLVAEKGLSWEIIHDENGNVRACDSWDL